MPDLTQDIDKAAADVTVAANDALDAAAKSLKIRQIPVVFNQIKGACELYFGVGLHMFDHPINGLATDLKKIHALIVSAETKNGEWLLAEYKSPQDVPQELQQAWHTAYAKAHANGATAALTPETPAPAPVVVDELAAARTAVAEAKEPAPAESAPEPQP